MYMYISQAGCAGCAYSCMYIHPEKCDFMRRRRASAKCAQWQESERMFSCWVHHFWRSASSPNVCPADIVVTWVCIRHCTQNKKDKIAVQIENIELDTRAPWASFQDPFHAQRRSTWSKKQHCNMKQHQNGQNKHSVVHRTVHQLCSSRTIPWIPRIE